MHEASNTVISLEPRPRHALRTADQKTSLNGQRPHADGACPAGARVVLYSHDTMGVGHMRRNLLIAQKLRERFPQFSILCVAGAKEAAMFAGHVGIECLALPAFRKSLDGTYSARDLHLTAHDLMEMRSKILLTTMRAFRPNLLIIDKIPAGAGAELLPTLEWISRSSGCRRVLGLRDILDGPQELKREWEASKTLETIHEFIDAVWVYGDPTVFDPVLEYGIPQDIARRVQFTGYLDPRIRLRSTNSHPNDDGFHRLQSEPFVLCTVGGGQDGEALARSFVLAMKKERRAAVVLTGPLMPQSAKARLKQLAKPCVNIKLVDCVLEGDVLLSRASHVVSMGGYNTMCSILAYDKEALIVPRVVPRTEQLIRARHFADRGLVSFLHPTTLSPAAICDWLESSRTQLSSLRDRPRSDGLERICEFINTELHIPV